MAENPEIRELIKNWLVYIGKNNIAEPDPQDLRNFLNDEGFDSPAIEQSLKVAKTLDPQKLKKRDIPTSNVGDSDSATVPSDIEPHVDPGEREVDFNDEGLPPFTDVADMDSSQQELYRNLLGSIKAMNDKQRKLFAQEMKRFVRNEADK